MAYRVELDALEAKLRWHTDEKEALELRIDATVRALDPHREARRARAVRAALFAVVMGWLMWATALGLGTWAVYLLVACPSCCHISPSRWTETRADSMHVALYMYRMEHDEACPSAVALIEEGYVHSWADTLDAWGQPFFIPCTDDGDVGSAGPDGEMWTDDDVWRSPWGSPADAVGRSPPRPRAVSRPLR